MRALPVTEGDAECVVRIGEPGTYYVDRAIGWEVGKHGIVIDSCGVWMDLNGYELVGGEGSRSGIEVRAEAGAVIRGGTIRGWGEHGIDASESACTRVEAARCVENARDGVRLGPSGLADDVMACDNGGAGIEAGAGCTLRDCQAFSNASHGLVCEESCRVIDSLATANAGDGMALGAGSQARGSASRHNLGSGFRVGELGSLIECDAMGNEGDGIVVGSDGVVMRCRSHGSRRGAGIRVKGQGSRIDENTCLENRVGIAAERGGNMVTRNAIGASVEAAIDAAPGNRVGRLAGPPGSAQGDAGWSNVVL